eukprot:RCo035020
MTTRNIPRRLLSATEAARDPAIPFLPGNSAGEDPVLRASHRKVHHLNITNGVPTVLPALPTGFMPPQYTKLAVAEPKESQVPPWLAEDKVLKFSAYFTEAAVESAVEAVRLRRCTVQFFTEDGTAMVREQVLPNSGMDGGVLIRRMRVQLQDYGNRFAEAEDFNVGKELRIYGKLFHIVGCDAATRAHLQGLGLEVPPNEGFPAEGDHFGQLLARRQRENQPRKMLNFTDMEMKRHHEYLATGRVSKPTPSMVQEAQQFYQNGGQKLKFCAVWDDRASPHGDVRKLMLVVHVEDDTVEIMAENEGGGRDGSKLLVRQRVPRVDASETPFANTSLQDRVHTREATQQLTFGVKLVTDYFVARDFRVGETYRIHGKEFFLYDCDTFTREFCAEQYGVVQATGVDPDEKYNLKPPKIPRARPPPHDGFGTEEDSLQNWRNLLLRPTLPRDHERWLKSGGQVLRFCLRMMKDSRSVIEDDSRHFVLTVFLEDDSLKIDEIPIRNSGIATIGTKYLCRQKVSTVLPDGQVKWYTAADFQVGAIVCIHGKNFEVVATDERTRKMLMGEVEPSSEEELKDLVVRLKDVINMRYHRLQEAFRAIATQCNGTINLEELIAFYRSINIDIRREDAKVILSMFDKNGDGVLDYGEFTAIVHGDFFSFRLDELCNRSCAVSVSPDLRRQFSPSVASAVSSNTSDTVEGALAGTVADKTRRVLLKQLRDKIYMRRIDTVEAFRLLSGMSPDSRLHLSKFFKGLTEVFHMSLSPREAEILTEIFFPGENPCSLEKFRTMLDGGATADGAPSPFLRCQAR